MTTLRRPFTNIMHALREGHLLRGSGPKWLLMYGYDPMLLLTLRFIAWLYHAKVATYVFDSHVVAIEHKHFLRRNLLDVYFRVGRLLLSLVDCVLVLNEDAVHELGLKGVPFLVSRVGVEADQVQAIPLHPAAQETYTIVYAGALESCNCVLPLIKSLRFMDDREVRLEILGSGALRDEVARLAGADRRVTFHGSLPKRKADNLIRSADLLINLRDIEHPVAKYSFPSKLIEYMATGVPVLSTRVITDPQFETMVTVVDDLNPRALAVSLSVAKESRHLQSNRVSAAQDYVRQRHLWPVIAAEVYERLLQLSSRG